MKIQVLGSGCPTCKKLYEITQQAVQEMGDNTPVEYCTGPEAIQRIISLGAMSTPAIVVNDQIAMTGFTKNIQTIQEKIKAVK